MLKTRATHIDFQKGESRRDAELRCISALLSQLGYTQPLEHLPSGAPILAEDKDKKISVAHSRQWAVICVGESEEPAFGIDIEDKEREQLVKVAERFLSEKELKYVRQIRDGYVKAWTAKEAVFKALGLQGVDFKKDIEITFPGFDSAVYKPANRKFILIHRDIEDHNVFCQALEMQ